VRQGGAEGPGPALGDAVVAEVELHQAAGLHQEGGQRLRTGDADLVP